MKYYFVLIAAILLAACTDNEQFRVNGVIEGNPTLNLRVGYYAEGAYQTQITAAREGKFEFFGSSKQPTLVEVLDYEYRPLARLYATNGETFEIELDRDKPLDARITGNDITERWSKFLRDNQEALRGPADSANAVIAHYVAAHPSDIVSTLLMVTAYNAADDAAAADSVLSLIEPQARPSTLTESFNYMLQRLVTDEAADTIAPFRYADRADSSKIFDPADKALSLIAFATGGKFRDDSIVPSLAKIAGRKNIQILEIDLEPYANTLKGRSDTLDWQVGRIPGGLAGAGVEHLGIPSEPYFIVTDSAGAQLLRTPSPGKAKALILSLQAQSK